MTTDELQKKLWVDPVGITDAMFPLFPAKHRRTLRIIIDFYTGMSLRVIGNKHGLSPSRVDELRKEGLRLMLHPSRRGALLGSEK